MALYLIAFLVTIIISYLISTTIKPSNYPPGPSRLPIVGNTFLLKKLSKKLGGQYLALMKLSKDYKTNILGLKLGSDQYVVVFGRKLVQEIFTREEFQGRPDGFFIRLRTMGTRKGITMTDGPLWQEQRNFAQKQLRQLGFGQLAMENLIKDELKTLLAELGEERENVSLNKNISTAVLNVLWTITGGKQFSKDENRLDELLNLLRERSRAFDMAGGLLNQLPWMRFICPDYCGYNVIQSLNTKLFQLFTEIIVEHQKTLTSENRDFIDAYLHEKEESKSGYFNVDQLVAICLDFFIAGALTTSYTLDFAVLATVSNPHVQNRLHQELDKVLQRKQIPSMDDKGRLPYVEALLLESQRFQHVVPTAGPRRVLRDTTLDKYFIPKNSIVLMSLSSIHHDSQRWKDPEVFRPERYLTDKGEFIQDEGLCTFGLGKRRCPGEALAKNFLFLAFATLFHFYKISFPEGKEPSSKKPLAGILVTPQPYTVSLKARGEYDD